jgi:putative membrane protein
MKRYFYALLIVVVVLLGATFTYRNAQPVEFNYYFGVHWVAPLSFMLLTTLTIGAVIGFVVSLAMIASMQRRLLVLRREARQLEQEVHNLRALPIRDAP